MVTQKMRSLRESRLFILLNYTPAIIVIYLLVVTLAEILVTYADPRLGLFVHALLLSGIVIHTVFVSKSSHETLLLSMIFVPLIRLMSLSLPLGNFERIYWYMIVSIPIFAIMPMLLKQFNYTWQKVGITFKSPKIQIATILSGFVLGYIEYSILRPEPFIDELSFSKIFIPALILFFCTGLFEELIFRGILQQAAEDALGKWGAMFFSALIFTLLHIGYQSLIDLVFVFLAGAFWGIIFMQTRSIIGTTIAHGITNIMLFLIVPFLFFAPAPERPAGAPPVEIGSPIQSQVITVPAENDNPINSANLAFVIGISFIGAGVIGGIAYQAVLKERIKQDNLAKELFLYPHEEA